MRVAETGTRAGLKNILFATDFTQEANAALRYAGELAQRVGAKLYALHVKELPNYALPPETWRSADQACETNAKKLRKILRAEFPTLESDVLIEEGNVWRGVVIAARKNKIDLVVVGTEGRTGAAKFLMGSVAEEIFRQSPVPVLTIGPSAHNGAHSGARFHRILFATDFSPESLAATPYAISFAQENEAELLLLNVIHERERQDGTAREAASVANAMYNLGELVPKNAEMWCKPETVVHYGVPAESILELAEERGADLIVLGVRNAAKRMGAATHLERTTAHRVVVHAHCPVLTVRG